MVRQMEKVLGFLCALNLAAETSGAAHPSSYVYYRTHNFDIDTSLGVKDTCTDRCDESGLCDNNGTRCAALVQKYPCATHYAQGKVYAGWCDLTCGFCSATNEHSEELTSKTKARRVDWNATFAIWDSPTNNHVARFDIFSAARDARLGGSKAFLHLKEGPGYFFTTSPLVTLRDRTNGRARFIYPETPAWYSQGSCLEIEMGRPRNATGNATLLLVTSGEAHFELSDSADGCKTAISRVGYDDLHNNPVDYEMTGYCQNLLPGPGGAADFDDLDIQPPDSGLL